MEKDSRGCWRDTLDNRRREEAEFPEVCLQAASEVTEEKLQQMIMRRNQLLAEKGYLPPDESHIYWHKPDV